MVAIERGTYGVSTVGFLRTGIAAYRGPSALVKELVQNADDAPAKRLEFRIQHDALVVTNDGRFTDRDFESIKVIASGGKRDDAEATGTWGTGFTAVYQLTDRPEIRSSGIYLALDPLTGVYESGLDDREIVGTELRFPWRIKESELSRQIEVEPWGPTRISELVGVLEQETFQNLLFLNHLDEIVVCDARGRVPVEKIRVHRTRTAQISGSRSVSTSRLTVRADRLEDWQGTWTYLSREAPNPPTRWENGERIQLKRSTVGLAFGNTPAALKHHGLIFNTLPTPVRTGFRFHINADFYPTADRSSIVIAEDDKGRWNSSLLKTLAELASEQLQAIRDQSGSPEAFYDLLPMSCSAGAEYLQVIVDRVQSAARRGKFVSTRGGWQLPSIARTPASERIVSLVELAGDSYPEITPRILSPDVQQFLGVRELGLVEIALLLKERLRPGTRLEDAPLIVSSREKLSALVRELEKELASIAASPANDQPNSRLSSVVQSLPLALDQDGFLRRMSGGDSPARLVGDRLKPLLPPNAFILLDEEFQRTHGRFYGRFVKPLVITDIIQALRMRAHEIDGRPLAEAPSYLGSIEQLIIVWEELVRAAFDRQLSTGMLEGAPILLDKSGTIRMVNANPKIPILLADEQSEPLLDPTDAHLLHESLAMFEQVWSLAGVRKVTPAVAADLLASWCKESRRLDAARVSLNSVERLVRWYRYLGMHCDRIPDEELVGLRTSSVVLTSNRVLASSGQKGDRLSLPWSEAPAEQFVSLMQELDYLVAPEVVDASTRPFFERVLGMGPLSADRFLIHHVLPNVGRVAPNNRLELLRALRTELASLRMGQQVEVVQAISETELIPDQEGRLRKPSDIYHPAARLGDVFPGGWRQPDPEMFFSGADPEEDTDWLQFFSRLRLPTQPLPLDLLTAAREIAHSNSEDRTRRNQASNILHYIDAHWKEHYQNHRNSLKDLAELRWLPAANRSGWFRASELVPVTMAELVLSQEAVLDGRGRQISAELSELIGMPTTVPYTSVINHLVHLGESKSIREPTSIYGYLDQQYILREAAPLLRKLVDKPVIFNSATQTWFTPRHSYLLDVSPVFGARRLSLPDQKSFLGLFTTMGVRSAVDPLEDAIDLLLEMDSELHSTGRGVTAADCKTVLRAHNLLIQARNQFVDLELFLEPLVKLRNSRCIPSADDRILKPGELFIEDMPSIDEWFPCVDIPRAFVLDDQGLEHEALLQYIGVKRLSQVIRRSIDRATVLQKDAEWTLLISSLSEHFQRITESRERPEPIQWRDVAVYRLSQLEIKYRLESEQNRVESDAVGVDAMYDFEERRLLVKQSIRESRQLWPVAREIAQIIDPRRPSDVTSALHAVLELAISGHPERIEHYLDEAQYRRILRHGTNLNPESDEMAKSIGLVGVYDAEFSLGEHAESDQAIHLNTEPLEPNEVVLVQGSRTPIPRGREEHASDSSSYSQSLIPEASKDRSEIEAPPLRTVPTGDLMVSSLPGEEEANGAESCIARAPIESQPIDDQVPQSVQARRGDSETDVVPTDGLKLDHEQAPRMPVFFGSVTPNTPIVPINWSGLYDRYRDVFDQSSHIGPGTDERNSASGTSVSDLNVDVPLAHPFKTTDPRADDALVRSYRFVLSGTGLVNGFLSIQGKRARSLLANEEKWINVRTDEEETFKLYINVERGILFNQEALPEWFANNLIPAGARITLERESAGEYRIYPTSAPIREIENLRILEWEDGRLVIHSGVTREVEWEIDEDVYRAEIRLEDPIALAVQAADKKAVFEILLEVFAKADSALPEAWLIETVQGIRAISASTVPRELQQSLCFEAVDEPANHWRFNPTLLPIEYMRRTAPTSQGIDAPLFDRGLNIVHAQNDPMALRENGSAEQILVWMSALSSMTGFLNELARSEKQPAISHELKELTHAASQFIRTFRRVERILVEADRTAVNDIELVRDDSVERRLSWMIEELHQEYGEDSLGQPAYAELVEELIDSATDSPGLRDLLEREVDQHSSTAWDAVIRPLLDAGALRARERKAFSFARWLYKLDQRLSGRDRSADLAQLESRELAITSLEGLDLEKSDCHLAQELVEILRIDASIQPALDRLLAVAKQIAMDKGTEIAAAIRIGQYDQAFRLLLESAERDANWAAAVGLPYLAREELELLSVEFFLWTSEYALKETTTKDAISESTVAALAVAQRLVPNSMKDRQFVFRVIMLLDRISLGLRKSRRPTLALITELAAWDILSRERLPHHQALELAQARYKHIEKAASQLGFHDLVAVALRKRCELLKDHEKRMCFQEYKEANALAFAEKEHVKIARIEVLDQLMADGSLASATRSIIGDEFLDRVRNVDSLSQLVR